MTRRLLVSYLTVTVLTLVLLEVPLAVFYAQRERDRATADLQRDAYVLASGYEDDLENGQPLDGAVAEDYDARTGGRVVVVDAAGTSKLDTVDAVGQDLSTQPEIAAALAGRTIAGTSTSGPGASSQLYAALPISSGEEVLGALRVTQAPNAVDARIHRFWLGLVGLAAAALAVVALIGWWIARSMSAPVRRLQATASRFAHGDLQVAGDPVRGPPEIRELADALDTMATRLDELLREQRSFVADASHQLRTPLTALRLRLENLQDRAADDASEAELAAAVDEVNRLAALVGDLLQLARAGDHPAVGVVDLAQLTADRVDTWTAVAEAADVSIVATIEPGTAPVLAGAGAVEQILDNLLDNALNVSPPGSTIDVRVCDTGATRDLTITDHGPGLPDDQKALATQRFWRGSASTPGTGLGLAIVHALVASAGAAMALADTPGGGLAVTVRFARGGR